jgi:hypothetical protein
MAYITLNESIANAVVDLILSKLNEGSTCESGLLHIYSNGGKDNGTLLATLALSVPAFPPASDGESISHPITPETNAKATGTAAHFELVDRNGNWIISGSVGVIGSGNMIELDRTSITAGSYIEANSIKFGILNNP